MKYMKNRNYAIVLGVMMFLSLLSVVSAQPPFQQSETAIGITIEAPIIEYHKTNGDFEFYIHVHNATSGLLLDNTTTNCIIHLYCTDDGEHVIEDAMPFNGNGIDFKYDVLGSNFTNNGQYAVLFYCEVPGERGGFFEYGFDINPTGSEFTIAQGILYGFILILLAAFLYFTIYGIKHAEQAEWLIGYICASYLVLYLVISVLWILAKDYLFTFPALGNILWILWLVMGFGFLPFIFVISLYILGKEARATLEKDLMKQGYSREEAKEMSKKHR